MQQLSQTMTSQEFGQHYALELEEPIQPGWRVLVASVLAGLANGPLKPPSKGQLWGASDFIPPPIQTVDQPSQAVEAPLTVDQIMARARAAGMVP